MNPVRTVTLDTTERDLLSRVEQPASAEAYPLSLAQESMWFVEQVAPGTPLYNIPEAWRLNGRLDLRCLQLSLDAMVRRHEVLRTAFRAEAGKPEQIILATAKLPLEVVDLRESQHLDEQLKRFLHEKARQPFNLEHAPLARITLFQRSAEEQVLLLNLHHLISDGWSQSLFISELAEGYASFLRGQPCNREPLPIQYADYALWQREMIESEAGRRHLAYWQERFSRLPEKTLLLPDRPRNARRSYRGETQFITIPVSLVNALKEVGRHHGATLYMTLLAGLKILLQRYTRSDEVVVGSPMACRERLEVEGLLGLFVNTQPIRADLAGDPTFIELLHRVREAVLQASAHQEAPVELLLNQLQVDRSASGHPLFEVVFGWQGSPTVSWKFPGIEVAPIELDTGTAKFEWTLLVAEGPEGLRLRSEFNTDRFEASTMTRLIHHYLTLLQSISDRPGRPISQLEMLTPPETHELLEAGTRTTSDYERDWTVPQLFENCAAQWPGSTALVFGERSVSYAELNVQANRLARRLLNRGVMCGTRVGVCIPRSPEMMVGLLGILKAGAAYVPLDPEYPAERLDFMIKDAGVRIILTSAEQKSQFDFRHAELEVVVLSGEENSNVTDEQGEEVSPQGDPLDGAYVMYTSGSTGNPKGVLVPHRAIARLVRRTNYLEFSPDLVFLQAAPLTFDASTFEIWGALLNGAKLVLLKPAPPSLEELGRAIRDNGVTTVWLTAGLFDQMVDAQLSSLRGLKHLLAGGDILSPARVAKAARELRGCQLINGYGPTENTTFTCCWQVPRDWAGDRSVPIGRPISNTQVYILDQKLAPVPTGVPGELYAAGDGLALGYVGQTEVAESRFVSASLRGKAVRLYRTGDLARWLADGTIEFLGRMDHQVKIRGYRIEPAEVEAVLSSHPAIASAIVVALEDEFVGKELVAYWVPKAGKALPPEELRRFLSSKLPPFLVPAHFISLEKMPLTANGKVDRRSLPGPRSMHQSPATPARSPRTDTERLVAGIWCELLGRPEIGIDEDFFRLGGHSLVATQVISRLNGACGVELPVAAIFEAPTVARLAAVVDSTKSAGAQTEERMIPRSEPIRAAQLLKRLEEFSEEEIEELLRNPELKDVI